MLILKLYCKQITLIILERGCTRDRKDLFKHWGKRESSKNQEGRI